MIRFISGVERPCKLTLLTRQKLNIQEENSNIAEFDKAFIFGMTNGPKTKIHSFNFEISSYLVNARTFFSQEMIKVKKFLIAMKTQKKN